MDAVSTRQCSRCHNFKPLEDFKGKRIATVKTCVRCRTNTNKVSKEQRKQYNINARLKNPDFDQSARAEYKHQWYLKKKLAKKNETVEVIASDIPEVVAPVE